MNKMKLSILAVALCTGLTSITNAVTISPLGDDVPKNGTGIDRGNANNAENNFFRLQTFLTDNPQFLPEDCILTFEGAFRLPEGGSIVDVNVTGFDFAVVHYGVGKGGTKGSGGGVAFFDVHNLTEATFPSSGSGPNGLGGFSSLDLFKCEHNNNVPDGGTTVMLLGSAITGLSVMRRRMKS